MLRPLVPPSLSIDTFDGSAWLGVVPFDMTGVRPHFLPAVPGLSNFPEINLRTYVTAEGRPGVWFFSLDAHSRLAVRLARATFHLPYFDAEMSCHASNDEIHYRSLRTHRGAPPAEFAARYGPVGEPFESGRGTIENFLTERYCLYSADRKGVVRRGEVHHQSVAAPAGGGRGPDARDDAADRPEAAGDRPDPPLLQTPGRARLATAADRLVELGGSRTAPAGHILAEWWAETTSSLAGLL